LDRAIDRMAHTEVHDALPILSLKHLAHLSGTPYLYLRDIVARAIDPYIDIALSKNSGGTRPISAPEPILMDVQRIVLRRALRSFPQHPASFAYRKYRSIVDCAWRHVGARWLVKLDLHDFFGQISERQVYRIFKARGYSSLVSLELARICTRVNHSWVHRERDSRYTAIPSYAVDVVGHLPQGGPSSGALANAVATPMDHVLADLAEEKRFVYTRYSDDLVFSSDGEFHREKAVALIGKVAKAVKAQGFALHRRKTRIIPPGARHMVLGLLIDRASVRLTPEFRRRIQVHIRGVRKFGLQPHAEHRGFRSVLSFVSHVDGALAFAMDVEQEWARQTTDAWRQVLTAQGFPL